jgi:hypothetical protein
VPDTSYNLLAFQLIDSIDVKSNNVLEGESMLRFPFPSLFKNGPIVIKEPEMVISYASIPVKASTDWETCHGLIIPKEVMVDLSNIRGIWLFCYKYLKKTD